MVLKIYKFQVVFIAESYKSSHNVIHTQMRIEPSGRVTPDKLTCRSGFVLIGHTDSSTVGASPPPVSFSFFTSTLRPLQSPLQRFNLLPAPCYLFQKTIFNQPCDLVHGSLEDRFHDTGKLGLKRYYGLSHYIATVRCEPVKRNKLSTDTSKPPAERHLLSSDYVRVFKVDVSAS